MPFESWVRLMIPKRINTAFKSHAQLLTFLSVLTKNPWTNIEIILFYLMMNFYDTG